MGTHRNRIRLLDILRGFAVLGTLGTNIWIFAHLGDLGAITTFDFAGRWETNDLIRMFVLFLVNGKLLGLLTIMFGVGVELKYQQALRNGKAWPGVYLWTSAFLILEGFLHFVFVMEYDILMSYGVTAVIVAFIIKGGNRSIHRAMWGFGGFHVVVILSVLLLGLLGANMSLGSFQEVTALYRDGSWLQQVDYRLSNFLLLRAEAIFIIPMNIFLFLFGVRMMRAEVFSPTEKGRQQRSKLLKLGVFIGIPLNLFAFIPGGVFDMPVRYLFAPLMSLGYVAIISKMIEWKKWNGFWRLFENAGKMSLSCYVMQNIIASFLFYSWGFGLGGKLSALQIIGIWLCISMIQLLFASVWYRYFANGPMEIIRRRVIGTLSGR